VSIGGYGDLLGEAVLELRVDDADLRSGISNAKRETEGLRGSFDMVGQSLTATGRGMTVMTAGVIAAGVAAAKTGIDYESAFAGVRKTVNATEAEFGVLSQGIREMALEVPASATAIAGVAEAAGQLGIETPNILGFTRTMVDLGVSTNMTADQAATSLARLANITQMPQTEFGRLGSTVVALGNNFATTEAEIVEMGLRIAGAGHTVGMTEPQILGFATALSSVGIEAQAGGSAISRVMIQMASDVQSGGKNLELFASTAGMTTDEFRRAFQEDASGAIIAFIEGLGGIQSAGGDVFGVLEELGLSEIRVRDALLRAAGAGDLFRNAIELGSDAWVENTALTNEAAQRYATTASQLTILKNHVIEVGIAFSAMLLPALQQGAAVLSDVASFISGTLVPAFGRLPEPMKTFTLTLVGLVAVAGPVVLIFGALASALAAVSTPVLLVVAVGALLVAAMVAIEQHTGALSTGWAALVDAFHTGVDVVRDVVEWFQQIPDTIKKVVETIAVGGSAIGKLLRGDVIGAYDDAKKAVNIWREESSRDMQAVAGAMGEAGKAAREFASDTTGSSAEMAAAYTAYRQQVETEFAAVQEARAKDKQDFQEWLASQKDGVERQAEATVVWNASDRSILLSKEKFSAAMEDVLEQASADLGTKITQKDLERGFVEIWDPELGARVVNLQQYVDLVGQVAEGTAVAGDTAAAAASDFSDLGDGLHYTQSEVDEMVGRVDGLTSGIVGMGENAVGAFDAIGLAVETGTLTAGQAIDAFVANGKVSYREFSAAGQAELQKLNDALIKALAEGDFEAADALRSRIEAITEIMGVAGERAIQFGTQMNRVGEAYAAILEPAQQASQNLSEWEGRAKLAEQAGSILDQQLAAGTITQEQYNEQKERLNWLSERSKGAVLDEGDAIVDAGLKTAEYTEKLDQLNSQYEDKNSTEYRMALAALTAQYDPASAAGLTMTESLGQLATAMDTTIEKIVNLLVQLGVFDETQAEAILGVDTSNAEQGAEDATTAAEDFAAGDYMAAFEGDDTHAIEKAHNASDAGRTFADGDYTATLKAENEPAVTPTEYAKGRATGFAEGDYTATLTVKSDDAVTPTEYAKGRVEGFAEGDYTATLKADNEPAVTPTEYARGRATGFAEGDYTATLNTDNSNAIAGIDEVESRLSGVTRSFTIYAQLDYTAVTAGLIHVEGLLPHSPAKWGPLAFTPDWSYITAGFAADTLPAVESGVGALSNTFHGQRRNWWQYGRDLGEQYAGGITDSTPEIVDAATDASEAASDGVVTGIVESRQFQGESFLRELNEFSKFVIGMVADTADEFEDGLLDAASAYMDAAKEAYDLMEQGLGLLAKLDASNANLQRAKQAATDVKFLSEHIVISIGDSVALIDATRPEGFVTRAGEYADAAESGLKLMEQGADLLATLSDLTADLGRAQQAASDIKFLTEHIMFSIGDSARYMDAERDDSFVASAESYADSSTSGLDLMEQGAAVLSELANLSGSLVRAKDGATQIKFLTEHIMLSIGDSADYITATRGGGFIERAGSYAETAVAGMELMTAAGEALASLADMVDADFSIAMDAASQVKFLTEHIVASLGDSAALFTAEGLTHLQEYLTGALGGYKLMSEALPAIEALLTFSGMDVTDADLRSASDRIVELTEYIVSALQRSSSNFQTEGLTAVTDYATAATDGLGVMGQAGDALEAILLFGTIHTSGRDLAATSQAMVDLIELVIRQLELVAVTWDTKGLDAVSAFSTSANDGLSVMKATGEALAAILMFGDMEPTTRENLRQLAWEMTGVTDYILDMIRQIATKYDADALAYLQTFSDVASDMLGIVKGSADAFKAMVDHARVTQKHADDFLASWEIVIQLVQDVAYLASTQGVQEALRFLGAVQEIASLIQAANATIESVQPAALPSVPSGATGTTTAPKTGAVESAGGKTDTSTGLVSVPKAMDEPASTPKWNPDPVGNDDTITRAAKGIELPKLAIGGVVTRELDATIAESGAEAVIPLESHGAALVAAALVDRMRQSPEWARISALDVGPLTMQAMEAGQIGDDIDVTINGPVTINARDREDAERSLADIGWGVRSAKRRKGMP